MPDSAGASSLSDYPNLRAALDEGKLKDLSKPERGEPRCGPWDEREDGAIVCRKCGEVDWPLS
jgi:hypothetical protein